MRSMGLVRRPEAKRRVRRLQRQELPSNQKYQSGRCDCQNVNHQPGGNDLVNLIVTLEDRYEIDIDEEDAAKLRTVADVVELVRRLT